MTTEYKLNVYLEWTDEDRAKGVCPVPAGSEVTIWISNGMVERYTAGDFNWGDIRIFITAYLVHSVPREPIVRWLMVGGTCNDLVYETEDDAIDIAKRSGGRVVKMVEEVE